jgi:hypothetical protein
LIALTGVLGLFLSAVALAQGQPATRPSRPGAASNRSPATRPSRQARGTTRPATVPAETAEDRNARRALQLGRQAIDLMRRRDFPAAERALRESIALDPKDSTNLYNMACVMALTGRTQPALDYLEKSAEAGFTDFVHVAQDSDLDSIRNEARYKQIIANRPKYQRMAAQAALAEFKQQFGEGYIYELDEQNKLIFATNTDRETLKSLRSWLTAQAKSQWKQLFDHKPEEYISVVVPSAEDYRKIVRMRGVEGFYNPATRTLIAERLGQVMTHEFTHAMHGADQAAVGQEHPIWLCEGLAAMFEAAQFENTGDGDPALVPHDSFRLFLLQSAGRRNMLTSLDKLLKMEQPEFVRYAWQTYGISSSLLMYLSDQGLLRKFYDTYKYDPHVGYAKDKTGRAALEKVTGMPLAQIEKAWKDWMLHRPTPAMSTGKGGAFLGLRFGEANDGLRVDEVVEDGPAAKAGVEVGDVVVGVGAREVRDYPSLVPVLRNFKPGDRVDLKLRHGEKYRELPVVLAARGEDGEPAEPRLGPVPPPDYASFHGPADERPSAMRAALKKLGAATKPAGK